MERTNEPSPQEGPSDANGSLEDRLSALERRMEERAGAPAGGAEKGTWAPQAELAAELERHRDQLRDYEKALVERIADVDDDRRATASRLQRAWQTQREEIDERLRRHAGLIAGLLILFAVLFTVGLFLVYHQATSSQTQVDGELVAEVAEIRQDLDRLSGEAVPGDQLREDLARLSTEVREIASSLEQLENERGQRAAAAVAVDRAARDDGEARVAAEVLRLDRQQKRLSEGVESLRAALEDLRSLPVDRPGASRSSEPAPKPPGDAPAEETDVRTPTSDAAEQAVAEGAWQTGESAALPALQQTPELGDQGGEARSTGGAELVPGTGETHLAKGGYALQLIGFFNPSSLTAFSGRDGLPARVYYIRQTHRGRPWYAMIHSLHESYEAAEQALALLPEELVALNPWIRPGPEGTELGVIETGAGQ
jgi:DamX protein